MACITAIVVFLLEAYTITAKMNVLFFASDDMRPMLGAYSGHDFPTPTHPKMYTPNLDALAARSLLLKRAYVQQAVCSPSRTSLLTSRRPDTTHVYDLVHYFRKVGGNFTTIPQYFKQHGYISTGMGKIFHPGKASGKDDPISWSEPYYHAPNLGYWNTKKSWYAVPTKERMAKPLPDEQIADEAIATLKRLGPKAKTGEQPIFVAVGFHKPHLPFVFPEEMLKHYPMKSISVPENPYSPINMPIIAWSAYGELRGYKDIRLLNKTGAIDTVLPNKVVKNLRRAYYSALSFTDSQIGRVLEELKNQGLANNTIVSFWGDHGWQLGEHGEWCKHTNFELATHAPMMVHIPGMTDKGISTEELTEFVDLFPTLVDAAGLPQIPTCSGNSTMTATCTEGISLMELVKNPNSSMWKKRVFSQYPRKINENGIKFDVMGYTMRTDKYRYTEWVKFEMAPHYKPDWNTNVGVELYDHSVDPQENWNKADEPSMVTLRKMLSSQLHMGWRAT